MPPHRVAFKRLIFSENLVAGARNHRNYQAEFLFQMGESCLEVGQLLFDVAA